MNKKELKKKMKKYEESHVIFWKGYGHLIWRYDTGNTVQLCDIEAYKKRQGIGKRLLRQMVNNLNSDDAHCIYGFTAEKNKVAQAFYKAVGFTVSLKIDDLYKKGGAYLIVMPYSRAKKI